MERINREHVIFEMNRENEPVLSVESGTTVVFETQDCFSGAVQTEADTISAIDFSKVNPATGPLYIKDAKVGDALKVTIHKITLENQGAVLTAPGLGMFADDIEKEETVIAEVTDNATLYKGHTVPLRKMVGVIGTAPAGEGVNTGTPHDHGGNLDTTLLGEGATLYLPVNVEGALLAMGDMHSSMGDGEIMGSGLEVAGEIEVTVEVVKDNSLPLPFVETNELYATIASRETMEEASKVALDHMVEVIRKKNRFNI